MLKMKDFIRDYQKMSVCPKNTSKLKENEQKYQNGNGEMEWNVFFGLLNWPS